MLRNHSSRRPNSRLFSRCARLNSLMHQSEASHARDTMNRTASQRYAASLRARSQRSPAAIPRVRSTSRIGCQAAHARRCRHCPSTGCPIRCLLQGIVSRYRRLFAGQCWEANRPAEWHGPFLKTLQLNGSVRKRIDPPEAEGGSDKRDHGRTVDVAYMSRIAYLRRVD
jgi:hypothetical protein